MRGTPLAGRWPSVAAAIQDQPRARPCRRKPPAARSGRSRRAEAAPSVDGRRGRDRASPRSRGSTSATFRPPAGACPSWFATRPRSTRPSSGCATLTQPVAPDRQSRLGRAGRRFDAGRPDPDAERNGAGAEGCDGRRPRRRAPPHRPGGNQGNHRRHRGRQPDPRRGSGRRGSRSAQEADRPDGAARVQARRPVGQSAGRPAGPRAARQPGASDGRRQRLHRGQAPGDGLGRPAYRRQAELRPGRAAGHRHHLQHRGRAALRPRRRRRMSASRSRSSSTTRSCRRRTSTSRSSAAARRSAAASPSRARTISRSASRRASCR